MEFGYNRYFGPDLIGETFLRYYRQEHASFYSDDAAGETLYITRNRQLSTFHDLGLGATLTYTLKSVPGKYDVKLSGGYQFMGFHYSDFTDVRNNKPYSFNANVIQTVLSATF